MFFERLKVDFRYSSLSLYDILHKYNEDQYFNKIGFIRRSYEFVKSGSDFPDAFKASVEKEKLFTAAEKEKLISFSAALGTSSIDTQIDIINLYIELLNKSYEDSLKKYNNNSRATLLICSFIGLGIYVVSL